MVASCVYLSPSVVHELVYNTGLATTTRRWLAHRLCRAAEIIKATGAVKDDDFIGVVVLREFTHQPSLATT